MGPSLNSGRGADYKSLRLTCVKQLSRCFRFTCGVRSPCFFFLLYEEWELAAEAAERSWAAISRKAQPTDDEIVNAVRARERAHEWLSAIRVEFLAARNSVQLL